MNTTHKILIVDDEMPNQVLLEDILSSKYEVRTASNGQEALNQAEDFRPDLVLLDVTMPVMDGYETCRRLKDIEQVKDSPVIFVSGKTESEEILKGYEVGADDYVVKPFNEDELLVKIDHNLNLKQQRQELNKQVHSTHSVAFQAMNDASAYGAVAGFSLDILKCDNPNDLAQCLFDTLGQWGLHSTIQIRTPMQTKTLSNEGACNPLEEQVIDKVKNRERIFDFGARTIITYPHCSMLIKNMPLDDETRYGSYKDYLARICEGLEGRILAILTDAALKKRTGQLSQVFGSVLDTFRSIQERNYKIRTQSAGIVEDMMENLRLAVVEVASGEGLIEQDEENILNVGKTCLNETVNLFNRNLKFEEYCTQVIDEFEVIMKDSEHIPSDRELGDLLQTLISIGDFN